MRRAAGWAISNWTQSTATVGLAPDLARPPIGLQVSGRQLNCFRDNSQGSLLSVVPLCNAKCFATVPHGGHEKCFRVVLPDSTLAQSSYLFAADAQRSTFASPRHDHDVPFP